MSEKISLSNKIEKSVKVQLDKAIAKNGHTIGFVLEKLILYYAKYGLPEKAI